MIAGMEWAAANADIVNMSINGGPTDGTDPVSQAVDALSASEDVLFVTSAGNYGPGPGTVETPATADSALAVGAVDKSDEMAWFSAEGPRLGGTLVKPEIVAPGVDITAARAEGADIGEPVGEDYMILSGTSMASPHVAGAAALLLEAHPDWTWDQLKNALVTSADAPRRLGLHRGRRTGRRRRRARPDRTGRRRHARPRPLHLPARRRRDLDRRGHAHQRRDRGGRARPVRRRPHRGRRAGPAGDDHHRHRPARAGRRGERHRHGDRRPRDRTVRAARRRARRDGSPARTRCTCRSVWRRRARRSS